MYKRQVALCETDIIFAEHIYIEPQAMETDGAAGIEDAAGSELSLIHI